MKNLLRTLDRQKKRRYGTAMGVINNITNILTEKYKVKRIILIGSCLKEDLFHSHSDIDLRVEGLSDNLYFQALGELLIEAGGFEVDLIPMENVTKRMMKYVEKGEILYEKQ